MAVEIVILEEEAEFYAARLRTVAPGVVFHAGRREGEVIGACRTADAFIVMAQGVTPAMLAAAPRLRWIQALTTGIDPLMTLPGLDPAIPITTGRGVHGPQMSELAFLFMLAFARNVRRVLREQADQVWHRRPQRLLEGRTAVIVGVGAIGEELALRCKAFGMRTVGVSGRPSAPHFDSMIPRERITEAAAEADYLIAIVPLSDETRRLIDARVLDALRPHAVLINIARGAVVDEAALIERLRSGRIAGAGLDTFETEPLPASSPLWSLPNVILTPHIGGMSETYAEQILPLLARNVRAFAQGRMADLENLVRR